jgi:hypothetical protein
VPCDVCAGPQVLGRRRAGRRGTWAIAVVGVAVPKGPNRGDRTGDRLARRSRVFRGPDARRSIRRSVHRSMRRSVHRSRTALRVPEWRVGHPRWPSAFPWTGPRPTSVFQRAGAFVFPGVFPGFPPMAGTVLLLLSWSPSREARGHAHSIPGRPVLRIPPIQLGVSSGAGHACSVVSLSAHRAKDEKHQDLLGACRIEPCRLSCGTVSVPNHSSGRLVV